MALCHLLTRRMLKHHVTSNFATSGTSIECKVCYRYMYIISYAEHAEVELIYTMGGRSIHCSYLLSHDQEFFFLNDPDF
jgi:hypothetical protein